MPTARVLILRAPGTNCELDTAFAFEQAGAKADVFHINRLLENPSLPREYQILCIPGGFSYGDDLSAGRIFANQIRHHLGDAMRDFKAAGKLILGICNGFQVLIKTGMLLPDGEQGPLATLAFNECARYQDRWVNLGVASERCVFLRGTSTLYLPVAHAEGRFVARDAETLHRLEAAGQLVLRYTDGKAAPSSAPLPFPVNPNGAQANVAGICDETGRVFGLMPHPERFVDPTQHPQWTRQRPERGGGMAIFENAVHFVAAM